MPSVIPDESVQIQFVHFFLVRFGPFIPLFLGMELVKACAGGAPAACRVPAARS